ncbi:unnamed protein product [Lampetra planeri]
MATAGPPRAAVLTTAPLLLLLLFGVAIEPVRAEYGLLYVYVGDAEHTAAHRYCVQYNPQWGALPLDPAAATKWPLRNASQSLLCKAADVPAGGFHAGAALVERGNCTFYEKARLAQSSEALALLVVSKEELVAPGGNASDYENISIPIATVSHKDMLLMGKLVPKNASLFVSLSAPREPLLDYNLLLLFVIAVGTVAVGGYWAGVRDSHGRRFKCKREDAEGEGGDGDGYSGGAEEEALDVSPLMIFIFSVMCCVMLLLLFFFYDYLVYVVIAVFCLASSMGLYCCLAPLVRQIPLCTCRLPAIWRPFLGGRPQVRLLLLGASCMALAITWGVFRNHSWAWVLQDVLGVAFCLNMLCTVRMPSFRICVLLLGILFFYDIFFVFITPFLTSNGESIMVQVATGPSKSTSHEMLPMVVKVPRLAATPLSMCYQPFSLLGFGDILVPGLLVAYCHRFDVQVQSSKLYFIACTIAYGVGLLLTFLALALMRMGQPALLYLVPCTLLSSLLVACFRGELGMFWKGTGYTVVSKSRGKNVAGTTVPTLGEEASEQSPDSGDETPGSVRPGAKVPTEGSPLLGNL